MKQLLILFFLFLAASTQAQSILGRTPAEVRQEISKLKNVHSLRDTTELGVQVIDYNDGQDSYYIYYFKEGKCEMYTRGSTNQGELPATITRLNKQYVRLEEGKWRDKEAIWKLEVDEEGFSVSVYKE